MENKCWVVLTLGVVVCSMLCISGCEILSAKYERTVHLSAPLPPRSSFAAETHNGSITVNGSNAAGCSLTATITGRASTEQAAKEIAEKTKVTLKTSRDKLTVEIHKPRLVSHQSVSVCLDANVPNETNLLLGTHNGNVLVTNIKGRVEGTTHNGTIKTSHISGRTKLKTHNGNVICEKILGDARGSTHNGNIRISYDVDAAPVCEISLTTHNGNIDLKAPPKLSAAVDMSTHNGVINTKIPITLTGMVSRKKLRGKIGEGLGKLKLETYNGSIIIR
ncbi:MAG: DUF4097 family beta strand repeat-containing protein [Planctomycetota bacterium]